MLGRVVFPATGYLEMVRATVACDAASALHGVYFLLPLVIETPGLIVQCQLANGRFEVRCGEGEALADATVHCSGAPAGSNDWRRVDQASARAPSLAADVGALYRGFDAVGLQYGPRYRTLVQAWGATSRVLARLRARSTLEGTRVHPADLDDSICASAISRSSGGSEARLPFAVDDAQLKGMLGQQWAVRPRWLTRPPLCPL